MKRIELQIYCEKVGLRKKEFQLLKDALEFKKGLKKIDNKLKFRIVKLV